MRKPAMPERNRQNRIDREIQKELVLLSVKKELARSGVFKSVVQEHWKCEGYHNKKDQGNIRWHDINI